METALIIIGTLCGGMGVKLVEHLLSGGRRKDTLGAELRTELRLDVARIREELHREAQAADEWEARYWELKTSTLMANHKADATARAVDDRHDDLHLIDDFEGIINPDK